MNTKNTAKAPQTNSVEFTRLNSDVNGNPRYAFHFLNLVNEGDRIKADANKRDIFGVSELYNIALNKARKIGGRKFHNKQYGGGIVIQSYNTHDEESQINELKEVNGNFIQEFTPKQFKQLEKAIYLHFAGHTYKAITEHGKEGVNFNPLNFDSVDNTLGLAYTSTSSYAALWVCNGIYLMANDTHHFRGFTINEKGQFIAIVEDEDENEIFIEL